MSVDRNNGTSQSTPTSLDVKKFKRAKLVPATAKHKVPLTSYVSANTTATVTAKI